MEVWPEGGSWEAEVGGLRIASLVTFPGSF